MKAQIWIVASACVLVAIMRKRLGLEASLYQILQVLSVTILGKTPIVRVFQEGFPRKELPQDAKQVILPGLSPGRSDSH